MTDLYTGRNRVAQALFAPVATTYDRYARLLSFGQDPRWRSFLVSCLEAGPADSVLDVACGTGAVALELARRRVGNLVELVEARAEALPFEDATYDGLTFTYLLRYVDDPAATMRELARVVRPGARVAMLEFFVPGNPVARASWEVYVRAGLPVLGGLISPGWREVGTFLGPSIRDFWQRWPLERLLEAWRDAGIEEVRARPLSLGGGIVVWGRRAG